MSDTQSPIEQAIAICGNQEELARRIGRSQQLVSYWKRKKSVPSEAVLAIEAATGISRHDLRPDIFGPKPEAVA